GRRNRSGRPPERRRRFCRTSADRCPTTCFPIYSACPRSGCRTPIPAARSTRPTNTFCCRSPRRPSALWRVCSGIWARCRGRDINAGLNWHPPVVWPPKVRFYSGPNYASIAETIQKGEKNNETFAYDWPCTRRRVLRRAGECPGTHGDLEEHQGDRRDHARPSRLVDSILVSRRQPEADRLCDGHLLQDRRRREEGTQARQERGQAQSGNVIDPHSM